MRSKHEFTETNANKSNRAVHGTLANRIISNDVCNREKHFSGVEGRRGDGRAEEPAYISTLAVTTKLRLYQEQHRCKKQNKKTKTRIDAHLLLIDDLRKSRGLLSVIAFDACGCSAE